MTRHISPGGSPMLLVIRPSGQVDCLYDKAIDLTALGKLAIQRASHVEPDDLGRCGRT